MVLLTYEGPFLAGGDYYSASLDNPAGIHTNSSIFGIENICQHEKSIF